MTNIVTNLVATIVLSTNITEAPLDLSNESKVQVAVGVATVTVPGWLTNAISLSTNRTFYRMSWVVVPRERRPLDIKDIPQLPGMTNR